MKHRAPKVLTDRPFDIDDPTVPDSLVPTGLECPKCAMPSQKHEHPEGWKPKPGTGYYPYWFTCTNDSCDTTIFHEAGTYKNPSDPEKEQRVNWVSKEVASGTLEWKPKAPSRKKLQVSLQAVHEDEDGLLITIHVRQ